MPDWKSIAQDNFRDAQKLFEGKRYRSATSRFYYAVFSLMTFELIQRGAKSNFGNGKETPAHIQLHATLMRDKFTHFSEERREKLSERVRTLYRDRLSADYGVLRLDRDSASQSFRVAKSIFDTMGETYE